MQPANLPIEPFNRQLQSVLRRVTRQCPPITFAKATIVYRAGDRNSHIYFIERGQLKLIMLTPDGHECLLAILTAGDICGEGCLASLGERQETATTMTATVLHALPCEQFLTLLSQEGLLLGFIHYLATRIAEQQETIADLLTVNSERRLGKTLLYLARKLGKPDSLGTRIEQRITHEELAAMVGTTRPRVSTFMRCFLNLGLIEFSDEHFLILKEKKMREYLEETGRGLGREISKSVQ